MKVSYELEQGYIDVWNEESEEWDRYIKVQKKSIVEDKKIEKIDLSEWAEITYQEDWEMFTKDFNRNCNLFVNKINKIMDKLNEMNNK